MSLIKFHGSEDRVLDFIEIYFGISPDGGDGSLEAVLVVALFITITAIAMRIPGYRK